MKLLFSPSRYDKHLSLLKLGDALEINGATFDFSQLGEGETLPASAIDSEWFVGDVSRVDGELHLALLLPHGPNASEAERFPEPIHVTEDGPIQLPGGEP